MNATLPREQPGRTVKGHSAVLLPILGGQVDWQSFEKLLVATVESGIIPAVNMDTGYVQILTPETVQLVLTRTREILGPDQPFVAGAFVDDRPGDDFNADAYHRHIDAISREHALPIVFPSWGLCGHNDDEWLNSMTRIGAVCDRFLAFELSTTFVSYGRIVSLAAYESLLGIRQCIGAKHSSLERHAEWNRLVVRDRVRQEFIVLTGNDLAIDMIRWGSDYLLGLSAAWPEAFAQRDKWFASCDPRWNTLNDALQAFGDFAFRFPVPAYKHSIAQTLFLRRRIASPCSHPHSSRRPDSDFPILKLLLDRIERAVHA